MTHIRYIFQLFLFVVFFLGLYVYANGNLENMQNAGDNTTSTNCPDLLVKKGNLLLLHKTTEPEKEGVNPITFTNLDEYIQYLETQRKQGIHCPVLFLQQENNAQGQDVYRIRPDPFDPQGGLASIGESGLKKTQNSPNHEIGNPIPFPSLLDPNVQQPLQYNTIDYKDANRQHPPYNGGNYAGFDPTGLYVGKYTKIDEIHDSTQRVPQSDNPMDANWGGVLYTQNQLESGKYIDNNVTIPTYFTPKGSFLPSLNGEPLPPNYF